MNQIYKFPDIDATIQIAKLQNEDKILKKKLDMSKNFASDPDITVGGTFNLGSFNKKINQIKKITDQRIKIRDQIQLLKLSFKPLNYDQMTIGEFKQGIYIDTLDMINELSKLKKFDLDKINLIINKKYRKITIFITILIIFIICYILIKFLI
jgi:hypothetical protein